MKIYFSARLSLLAALVLVWLGPALGLHGILSLPLVAVVLALVWRFWRMEMSMGLDAPHIDPIAAAIPNAREAWKDLLHKLRVRSFFVAAGTFFATLFLFFWGGQFLGAGPIDTFVFSVWESLETVGIEIAWDDAMRLLTPATIVVVIVFPVLAILSILLATLLGGSGQIRTPRIALLRPFGERKMTQALKRVVARRLGKAGFCYTLSDRHYKPNVLVTLVVSLWGLSEYILGPIFRPSIRYMNVHTRDRLDDLKALMQRRVSPSWRTALSGNQALNIKSTDDHWQDVVDILLETTDFVVMDVSKVGGGSAWEIGRLFTLDLARRCIFIAQEGHEENARTAIAAGARGGEPPVLHVFQWDGRFLNEEAFQREMSRQLLEALHGGAPVYSAAPA